MEITRRSLLAAGAAACGALVLPARAAAPSSRMGLTMASYMIRGRLPKDQGGFNGPLSVLDHLAALKAGGVQIGVGNWDLAAAHAMRDRAGALGMYLEGQIGLPKKAGDADRFEKQIVIAKEAGIDIVRAVTLGSRRYETFKTVEDWQRFREGAMQSLAMAEPILRKHGVRLALENHKDWRIEEMVPLIQKIDSEHVRVCLDTGNNLALLDDLMETVRVLAPFAITTHLKDMAVQPAADGFTLSEIPLGDGMLDIAEIVRICRAAHPAIRFNLEMITRDPLRIPCLTEAYWATFGAVPAQHLAAALRTVQANPPKKAPPVTSGLNRADQLELEQQNVEKCFAYARQSLGL